MARQYRADPARRAAYDVLRAVDDRDAYANLLLPALLTERGLTGRDAAFATELTYGTLRGRGTYDAILDACSDRDRLDPPVRDVLRLGAHQLLATKVGAHAAVATSVDLAKDVCGPRPSGFVNAVLRRLATRDLDAWIAIVAPDPARDPVGYLSVRHSYPRWIVEAFREALGAAAAETSDALAAGNLRPEVVLALAEPRAATGPTAGKATAEAAAGAEAAAEAAAGAEAATGAEAGTGRGPLAAAGTPTRWSPYGLRLAGGDPTPLVAGGRAAVQDEASQLAALALTRVGLAGRDDLWLDLCAGPGGKARLLSGLAAARGARLVASDVRPARARKVLAALRRARPVPETPVPETPAATETPPATETPAAETGGAPPPGASASASAVIAADGLRVPWQPGTFDRVLADVPCSGLGSLRRRPEARWRKTPADVQGLAELQRRLLESALDSVRPGGVVAYVTCSPHVAETSEVVTAVVASRDDVSILDAPAVLAEVPGLRADLPEAPEASETPGRPDSPLGPRTSRFAQFWPHRHGTDGIFLALLRRG
jgi:16S rRNA (cytosine967-C5)-methyltransferase